MNTALRAAMGNNLRVQSIRARNNRMRASAARRNGRGSRQSDT